MKFTLYFFFNICIFLSLILNPRIYTARQALYQVMSPTLYYLYLFFKSILCVWVFVYVYGCCMSVLHICAWSLWRPEDSLRSSGTEVTGNCEMPCGCWDLNPGPLEEQPMFLITGPSLQPLSLYFIAKLDHHFGGLPFHFTLREKACTWKEAHSHCIAQYYRLCLQ